MIGSIIEEDANIMIVVLVDSAEIQVSVFIKVGGSQRNRALYQIGLVNGCKSAFAAIPQKRQRVIPAGVKDIGLIVRVEVSNGSCPDRLPGARD